MKKLNIKNAKRLAKKSLHELELLQKENDAIAHRAFKNRDTKGLGRANVKAEEIMLAIDIKYADDIKEYHKRATNVIFKSLGLL